MIKLLHAADLHLDSPLMGHSDAQRDFLQKSLLEIPEKIAQLCHLHQCDLILLCGDLFDGPYTKESFNTLRAALEEAGVPTFISPGNHDYCGLDSPWLTEIWPKNVHIFTKAFPESVSIPQLDCRIYGAGFQSMDCPGLLENFHATGNERYHIGIFHGDPTQLSSPYNPITMGQVRNSGLEYLALGHIHKADSFQAGSTLCAWPGCPMGRGYDETGNKGVLLVTIAETAAAQFIALDVPQFIDLETEAGNSPLAAAAQLLPPMGNQNFYRITFTGYSSGINVEQLSASFSRFPNLIFRDRTIPENDLWNAAEYDTLEGIYFRKLRDAMNEQDEADQHRIRLAAQISRQLLDGQEVKLP